MFSLTNITKMFEKFMVIMNHLWFYKTLSKHDCKSCISKVKKVIDFFHCFGVGSYFILAYKVTKKC